MAIGRGYTVTAAPVTVASTAATPILCGAAGATVTADIQAIRAGIFSGPAVSYPSNGTVQLGLYRATGSPFGSGSAVTPEPDNPTDIAANTTWIDAHSGAITGLTQGTHSPWMSPPMPFTAGAGWGEWVTPAREWRIPASGQIALYVTCSAAGTATQFAAQLIFTE